MTVQQFDMAKTRRYYKRGLNRTEKKQVKKLAVAAVKPMMELKHHDTAVVVNVTNATFGSDLINPTQAITDTGRIGDRIHLQSVSFSLRMSYATAAVMRIMLVQWHDNTADNGINATDLFQFALSGGVFDANTINNIYNIDQTKKFTVLYDRKFSFNPQLSAVSLVKTKNIYIKKRFRKEVQFNEAVTSGTNKIYLLHFSDTATAGGLNGYCRVRYYDA